MHMQGIAIKSSCQDCAVAESLHIGVGIGGAEGAMPPPPTICPVNVIINLLTEKLAFIRACNALNAALERFKRAIIL